jgi:metal-responsive CopG/Arc/MetJ family transcriptional regulator
MGTTPVGFRMDEALVERLDAAQQRRGLKNRSDVVILACREFIQREENPNLERDRILAVLEENPQYLEKPVRAIIEQIAAQQLSQK